jgi:hypothetical protein
LRRALGDPDHLCDIAHAKAAIPGDANEDEKVIRQERPSRSSIRSG